MAFGLDAILIVLVRSSLAGAARWWGASEEDSAIVQLLVTMFTLVFTAVYTTVLHTVTGQTIGKMVTGVRVVASDGEPLTVGASFLRYLAYYVSAFLLGLGFVVAGLRRDKRAIHDLLAGSRVERERARVAAPSLSGVV